MGKYVERSIDLRNLYSHSCLATLDSTKIIEVLDPDTVIFYQVHKRVWPAAQRDSCFWSHIRCISNSEEDQPTWLVVNYTTPHPLALVIDLRNL